MKGSITKQSDTKSLALPMGINATDFQYIYGCMLSFIPEGNVKFQIEISENEDTFVCHASIPISWHSFYFTVFF